MVLALVIVRGGWAHDDRILLTLGSVTTVLSLALVVMIFYRQQTLIHETGLASSPSVVSKKLLCCVLGLSALGLMAHGLTSLGIVIWR